MPEPVAIIPLHDHSATVCEVLDGVRGAGLKAIVVDDGSTDGGDAIVERWILRHPADAELVRMNENRGKAAALIQGMQVAESRGARIAITIDADGQHDAACLRSFAEAAHDENSLVLGNREPIPRGYPLARLSGRMLSCIAVRAACGAVVHDAACGFRAYPLRHALSVKCTSGRYAWEEEIIARLTWRGVGIREVPIPVIYRDPEIARSHYRFLRDWPEGMAVLAWTIIVRVLDPRAKWSRQHHGYAEMAWPVLRGDRLSLAFAALSGGVSASIAATTRAFAPMSAMPIAGGVTAFLIGYATVRVRAAILPVLAGGMVGWLAPPLIAAACLPLSAALAVWSIARLRKDAR